MLKIQSDYLSVVYVLDSNYIESNIMEFDTVQEDRFKVLVKKIIQQIDDSLYLTSILGELNRTFKGSQGYQNKYEFGNSGVTVAFNQNRPDMGVLLQMSGSALHTFRALYLQKFGELIEVNHILKALNRFNHDGVGKFRISRFDAAIDFIDENVDLTKLYNGLENEEIQIYNHKENLNTSQYKSIQLGKKVQTIYVGSRQSNNMLRIYNKKDQVLENNLTKDLEQAVNCEDWYRFEMEVKKESAHLLTEILLNIETIEEFQSYLAQLITDKFRFGLKRDDVIEYTEITQKMLEAIEHKNVEIEIPRLTREYDLRKSEEYFMLGNSGLQSLIYKQRALFGEDYVREWLEKVLKHNKEHYVPSLETARYVRDIKEEQRKNMNESF